MLNNRFDAIIFDLDGTLIDSEPDLRAALNATLLKLGRRGVTQSEVLKMIGDGVSKLVQRGFAATGGDPETGLDSAVEIFSKYYEGKTAVLSTPFADVEKALQDLQALGLKLGVCTNKPQNPAEEILESFDLFDFFEAIVGGDALDGIRKPDGRHLAAVLEKLGVDKERAVMVGDTQNDAAAASALCVPFIAVSFGYTHGAASELGADTVIYGFKDLIAALERLPETHFI